MAKQKYDGQLDRHTDFTQAGPNGEPASGYAVQNYIKGIDAKKVGIGYTLPDGSAHLFFADAEDRDAFIADPTKEELIIDRVALEALYSMTVTLLSDSFVPVALGSTGNYIRFSFVTKNKHNENVNEDVTAVYTISRGSSKQTITQVYRAGTTVAFNVDNYLLEGMNNINIVVTGAQTGISVATGAAYQVVNLTLEDSFNISTVYDSEHLTAAIPYSVSGVGQKIMEWFVDGTKLDYNQAEDEITETSSERTKYISLAGLSQGAHSIQFRVGVQVSGETFYSKTCYREVIVSMGDEEGDAVAALAVDLPSGTVVAANETVSVSAMQYENFSLRVAAWNPDGTYINTVTASVGGSQIASTECTTGEESLINASFSTTGEKTVTLAVDGATRTFTVSVSQTDMNIHEITSNLEFAFSADGRTNSSTNKSSWSDGTHTATFTGFNWNNTSGWVDGKLLIPSGASISFNYAPLAVDPCQYGKTIEIDFKTVDVDNDDAVLMNIVDANGAGIKLTATELQVTSQGAVNVARRFKTNEDIRVSIVINKRADAANQKLLFVYFNGINSIATGYAVDDSFITNGTLSFGGTNAGILLKQVRVYNVALSSDNIVNNYILYQDSPAKMLSLYEKNSIYEEGTSRFDLDKIAQYLPVMVITGNIPAIEATTDKKLQITADIKYTNLQDPSRSFTMEKAIMTGQGTSSMTYPKKNYRIYTQKSDETVVYDANGKPITSRLYSFKAGAQPVNCWCLKTDFAESSGTHNTGVARLWNDVIKNTQVNGEYVLRTDAQKAAISEGYHYDVRTTVDGFPIAVFYHLTEQDDLIFLGKFNFNNDKSTESVFGFCNIPGFTDTNVQCFEFLDSGNELALFHTIEDFDTKWDKAWESRYPDTKTPNLTPLKTLATWLVSTYGADPEGDATAQAKFEEWQTNKGNHFDLYKLASYYVYLMRFGAVDQTVKNSMLMTEDGVHWFFILYDNDTIFGVRNDGLLRYGPDIDRQTQDLEIGGYAYAGHSATIWNNFEADPECMALAKQIDNALYSAGLTYENVINMFNNLQAGKWAEVIYNQDAQYKYIGPYVNQGLNYLGSLQGARVDHRKWWVSSRFAKLDAEYVSGAYTGNAITLLIPGAQQGTTFSIKSGHSFYYGYGENNLVLSSGNYVEKGQSHTFTLSKNMEIGSPLRIYAPYYIEKLDLSNFITYVGATNFNLAAGYNAELGSRMKELILGVDNVTTDNRRNTALANLSGITSLINLTKLNVAGYQALATLDISALSNLEEFYAKASGLTSVTFADGGKLTHVEMPSTLQTLAFKNQPNLTTSGIVLEGDGANIKKIDVRGCANISNSPTLLLNWLTNKTTPNAQCEVLMDNVNWNNVAPADLLAIGAVKADGGSLVLRGTCALTSTTQEVANQLMAIFGASAFQPGAEFFISAPDAVYVTGPTSVLEGNNQQYAAAVFSSEPGTVTWSLSGSRTGTSLSNKGLLTTTETGEATSNLTITVQHVSGAGVVTTVEYPISVVQRSYPSASQVDITGNGTFTDVGEHEFELSLDGTFTGDMTASWALSGDLASNATIVSPSNTGCTVRLNTAPSTTNASGTLTLTLTKTNGGSTVVTKTKDLLYQQVTTITVSEVTNQSSHADVANAQATVSYVPAIANGVYILYTDGSLSAYDSLTSGKTTVGVVLKTDNVSLVIHPSEGSSKKWSSDNSTEISGVTTTTDQNTAKADYAGAANTAAVIASGKAGTAFTWATECVYADGRTGYLPSVGEQLEMQNNKNKINTALNLIGGTSLSNNYWSSTQYSTNYAWRWYYYGTEWSSSTKVDNFYCRSVAAFITSTLVGNGQSTDVPRGASVTVTYSPVTNYATPAPVSITATGASMSLTGTYNTEVVNVNVTTSDGASVEGQIITINGNALTVGASGTVSAKVAYGVVYTVSANKKSGYGTPVVQSFTAGQVSRGVTMEYTERELGVFILYTDGTKSAYNVLDSGKTPVGVAVVTDNVSLVLHPNEGSSKTWSSDTSTDISGVTTTTDRETAKADFNGASNTSAAVASGLAGSAFTFATTDCVYADGKTGYLPSCGEMEDIRLNETNINTALNLIGGTALDFASKNYWSSTQYSDYRSAWKWVYGLSYWNDNLKSYNGNCRSVAAL